MPEEESDDAFGGEDDEGAQSAAPAGQLSIFISHRCVVEPDRSIALRLREDLSPYGDVYVNTAQGVGVRWDEKIKESLDHADFVIALVSERANESEWVKYELSYAALRFQREGRPIILPVFLGFEGNLKDLSAIIGASTIGFNPISIDPGDYAGLLSQIQAAIRDDQPTLDPSVVGLEGFLVGEFRKSLTRAVGLDSPELRRAGESLRAQRLFWVVGDPGVRNYFARALAVREHDREAEGGKEKGPNIYEVTRSLSWSRVDDTLVRESIIIFTDVLPAALFDEEASRDELKSLKRLAARNLVIVTASEESYSEIEQEMRNREFGRAASRVVGHGFYDERAKLEIFERLLDFSYKSRDITRRQHQWAHQLREEPEGRETFRAILNKWSPSDIERFVTRHMRQVKRQGDILRLLQRNADLDNEIHTWFVALDDSTRCFVLALAMLPGLRREQLWMKYKLIVERLKGLDGGLSMWPLGICRQHAAPYVTTEGQLDFVDGRIAEAVQREVTINFREYLIELVPLIKEMSVPPGREQGMSREALAARKAMATESGEVRAALARLVGKAGRQGLEDFAGGSLGPPLNARRADRPGLEDFRNLLEFWGADPSLQVREAVAISLEQAVTERAGAKHALGLLGQWCNIASNHYEVLYKAAAAASALAAIVAAKPVGETYERALRLLKRLASSTHPSIKFYVSISLRKAARKLPLVEQEATVSLTTLLSMVAQDGKASTKINVAEALNEARIADEAVASQVIRGWASGEDADCRWVAVCSLFLWRKQRNEERVREAVGFLTRDAQTTAGVLVEIINHKHEKTAIFWGAFSQLVREADAPTREALVSGLAELPQASLDERLLPLLRAAEDPSLSGLAVELRAERWRRMFSTPPEFIADLRKEVYREDMSVEIYKALDGLLKPEPWGHGGELLRALVSCFPDHRESLDAILVRLKGIAPALFEPLSVEVRREGFRRLLNTPMTLVAVVAEGLTRTELAGDTGAALAALTQPEPQGYRQELLRALADSQATAPAPVFALLQQFRASGNPALARLAYELNLRALEGDITDPERFLSRVIEMMHNAPQRAEVLQSLQHLSTPGPQGRRRELVRALGTARVTRPAEVNALLQEPGWQPPAGVFSLGTEVKLFSFISYILSPNIAAAIFGLAN